MTTLAQIQQFLDSQEKGIIELETLLTSHPALAPESDGTGEIEKAAALETWLKEQGIVNIQHFDAPDARVPSKIRPNMVATIPGKRQDSPVWIMSHLDVVPEGERSLWESDPWKVIAKNGKLYGRGVEDNQQGLVSSVFAALAFLKLGVVPERTIKLLFYRGRRGRVQVRHYSICLSTPHFLAKTTLSSSPMAVPPTRPRLRLPKRISAGSK